MSYGRGRYRLKGRKSLPLASGYGVGLAQVAPHGSTRPDELVQGSDPRLWGAGYRFYPGGIGGGGGSFPKAHNSLTGKQGGKAPDEFYHAPKLTAGAIPFADANGVLTEDAANLFWDAANKQLQTAKGTAPKPVYSFISYPTMGLYAISAGDMGVAFAGVRRHLIGSRSYQLEANVNDIAYFSVDNANAGANAAAMFQLRADAADVYSRIEVAGNWWAYGMDMSEGHRFAWGATSALGAADKMRLERTGALWIGGDLQVQGRYIGYGGDTNLLYLSPNLLTINGNLDVTGHYEVDGTQVVSNQGPPILDSEAAWVEDGRTKFNQVLARLRAHGLIAT